VPFYLTAPLSARPFSLTALLSARPCPRAGLNGVDVFIH